MALVIADRVKETTNSTGIGDVILNGAATQFQSFAAGIGTGNTTYYCVLSGDNINWETGTGTIIVATGTTTLHARSVFESSNGNNPINLSGTSTVFCTAPAASLNQWGAGQVSALNLLEINSGTLAVGPLAPSTLVGNSGTGTATAGQIALGAAFSFNGTTLNAAFAGNTDVTLTSLTSGDRLHYNGTKWVNGREPYILSTMNAGTLSNSQVLLLHEFSEAVTMPVNLGTTSAGAVSEGFVTTAFTAGSTLIVNHCSAAANPTVGTNWAQVGSIVFGAAGYTPTFGTSSTVAVSYPMGDRIEIVNAATADTTAANLQISLAFDR